jgi:hypothetical protein
LTRRAQTQIWPGFPARGDAAASPSLGARHQRELDERRALLRRVALAASVLPAPCVGCALRLALAGRRAERVLDELLAGVTG